MQPYIYIYIYICIYIYTHIYMNIYIQKVHLVQKVQVQVQVQVQPTRRSTMGPFPDRFDIVVKRLFTDLRNLPTDFSDLGALTL